MGKPTDSADWATDTLYPAGADPWSGTPTKVDPLAGKKATGHVPADLEPAQTENWWKGLIGRWIAWLVSMVIAPGVDYALTANTDDADVQGAGIGVDGIARVRVTASDGGIPGGFYLGGFIGGEDGQEVEIVNVGVHEFFLTPNDSMGDSFLFQTQDPRILLNPGAVVCVRRDAGAGGWIVTSSFGASVWSSVTIGAPLARDAFETTGGGYAHAYNRDYWQIGNSNTTLDFGAYGIPENSRMVGCVLYIDKGTDATDEVILGLSVVNSETGVSSVLGFVNNSSNAPGLTSMVVSNVDDHVNFYKHYYATFTPGANPTAGGVTKVFSAVFGFITPV